jgi:hypothetical protein
LLHQVQNSQIHLKVSVQPVTSGFCKIRTMTGTRWQSPPKGMEAQDYVSKNERLEKVHRAMVTGKMVIKYH